MPEIREPLGSDGAAGDWTPAELEAVVTDYRSMLSDELKGVPYSKADHRRALMTKVKRSEGSIEFKHQNISAVLEEVGSPWIKGYKPRHNYQDALVPVVARLITAQGDTIPPPPAPKDDFLPSDVFVSPPAPGDADKKPKNAPTVTLAKKIDQAARDARNRATGEAGESFVVALEKKRLAEFPHLSKKVVWASKEKGDGLGYDIESFEEDGSPLFIEVKTTRGGLVTPFIISKSEVEAAAQFGDRYRLYRVFNFGKEPNVYVLRSPLVDHVEFTPADFRAVPRTAKQDAAMLRYFAYGSNMSTARLQAPDRVPGCKLVGVAVLPRYVLRFHKYSRKDHTGKCNAFFTGSLGDRVLGAVFEIPKPEKPALDKVEGLGKGYDEKEVDLTMADGTTSRAFTYVAAASAIDDKLLPTAEYRKFVLEGAKELGLPTDYIEEFIAIVKDAPSE